LDAKGGAKLDEKGSQEDEDEDEGSVGGEIESFRSVVDWVESLIGEDEVSQGRGV
jgi:hypothetical protein